ncbi:MAG: hypothetical protein IJ766_01080, partial [Clostridia bacterium]|nr:hypothetical protein [Clostridia bacterium]
RQPASLEEIQSFTSAPSEVKRQYFRRAIPMFDSRRTVQKNPLPFGNGFYGTPSGNRTHI